MGNEHKKPVTGTAREGRKSHILRGEGLCRRRRRPEEEGRASQRVNHDLSVVVASRPADLKIRRSWGC